jgi:acyl-CoA thioester hydrolase
VPSSRPRAVQVDQLPAPVYQMAVRIYYEDTDAGGIVYHANYLRYFERARSDWLRSLGAVHTQLQAREAVSFVVRDMVIDYRTPARLDDLIHVDVRVIEAKRASMQLAQVAFDEARREVRVTALLRVAAIQPTTGRPVGFPVWLTDILAGRAPARGTESSDDARGHH